MTALASRLACAGCGAELDPDDPAPWQCPQAGGDDIDHVVTRALDLEGTEFPFEGDPNPLVRFRELLHAYRAARRRGVTEEAWCDRARRAFGDLAFTPFREAPDLAAALGGGALWIKDETGGAGGSHKARHLRGVALHLAFAGADRPRLLIPSCGNAALAAAEVAAGLGWTVETFVPPDAAAEVRAGLEALGARLVFCPRRDGDPPGDPCWHRYHEALVGDAVPFSVAGPANGLTIETAATLPWELVAQDGPAPAAAIDDLYVQVGGGALFSACHLGLREAHALGALARVPRMHAVQTAGAHPLERAWRTLATELATQAGAQPGSDTELAAFLYERRDTELVQGGLARAARARSRYMRPWDTPPVGVATGILDDETHDWHACVRALFETGGRPLIVDDEEVLRAVDAAREHAGVHASPTGAAGLAGWAADSERGDRRGVVLLTGVAR